MPWMYGIVFSEGFLQVAEITQLIEDDKEEYLWCEVELSEFHDKKDLLETIEAISIDIKENSDTIYYTNEKNDITQITKHGMIVWKAKV